VTRITVRFDYGRRRKHLIVTRCRDGWTVALAIPSQHGHWIEYPWKRRFKLKSTALYWMRERCSVAKAHAALGGKS
jgi:hypothetical protein